MLVLVGVYMCRLAWFLVAEFITESPAPRSGSSRIVTEPRRYMTTVMIPVGHPPLPDLRVVLLLASVFYHYGETATVVTEAVSTIIEQLKLNILFLIPFSLRLQKLGPG